MEKKFNIQSTSLLLLIVGILLVIIEVLSIINGYHELIIVISGLILAYIIIGFIHIKNKTNPEVKFENKVNNILTKYESILAKSKEVPNLDNRNIVILESFQDLAIIQNELKKPILYIKQVESYSFILLDNKEAYIYIERLCEDTLSPIEAEIKNSKRNVKNKSDIDAELLAEIEKTTIVKLPNTKSYKISPVKKDKINKTTKEEKESEEIIEKNEEIEEIESKQIIEDNEVI